FVFFFQAEDGIRDLTVTGVQTCALPIYLEIYGFATHARVSQDQKDGDVARAPPLLGRVDQRIHEVRPRHLRGRLTVVRGSVERRSEERRVGKECRARWARDE